jgi:tRNA-splicing ligase RtcB (3'-phosphate/5'-hydroxy nucleic acid ligase)
VELSLLKRVSEHEWRIEPQGRMRVPGVIFGSERLVEAMDRKVYDQVSNVATLPGIQAASFAMPDAHWGYGFTVGGVAAFDPEAGGVVSAGGVGFDISCGVRCLRTRLSREDVLGVQQELADALFRAIPAGVGSRGRLRLSRDEMDRMLVGGARWAVERGYGEPSDLELQAVVEIHDAPAAEAFGLREGDVVLSVHCGSRGLGHQIGSEALKEMLAAGRRHGLELPDRELACAPIGSEEGESYLGAMRAAINAALANRQVLTELAREAVGGVLPRADLTLLYDVSHNTCKIESHELDGRTRRLFVHRKGATRAFGPGHPELPDALRPVGQPVLIGGTMGTCSYVLVGSEHGMRRSFGSACHGAGRSMSRHQALKQWNGREVLAALEQGGMLVRSPSLRGIAEEAPGAYKDVTEVVDATQAAGLARKVARLSPLITVKG